MQRNLTNLNKSDITVESMFYYNRFPTGLKLLFLCFYFPFGCLLAVLRIFIGFHAFIVACALRKWTGVQKIILRIFCAILGVIVLEEGVCESNSPVFVSNQVSVLDHLAIYLVCPCFRFINWPASEFYRWCFRFADLGGLQEGRSSLIRNAKTFCRESPSPLLIFPEEYTTNGKVGLLKFNTWPFSLEVTVQPVFISLSRPPFADLTPTVIGARWKTDLFWFLFAPVTIFRLKWLKPSKLETNENGEIFSERVQKALADVGSVATTNFTRQECLEFVKKYKIEQKQTPKKVESFDSIATSVKEILPQVPLHVIRKDLERTGSVDATVSNLLEGRTPYSPEVTPSVQPPKKTPKPYSNDPSSWKQLYDDRKRDMIADCRRRYLIKKNKMS